MGNISLLIITWQIMLASINKDIIRPGLHSVAMCLSEKRRQNIFRKRFSVPNSKIWHFVKLYCSILVCFMNDLTWIDAQYPRGDFGKVFSYLSYFKRNFHPPPLGYQSFDWSKLRKYQRLIGQARRKYYWGNERNGVIHHMQQNCERTKEWIFHAREVYSETSTTD